ncbi:DNA alkylation repair enzyme [Tangfeifania diversioriginum]|uniref:DNA alkylation repair enzyme n=1 Tax=Tangfeifania diversioriginum TaxID=1168035 RepID=A0A1M6BG25_9BACT|nr:DNA alkylation repair protein [Tangfeifania diversioriginum]SHI47694.1 DNA alkylation repair enzyme [Tangfeifania diversioriginum]
MDFLLDNGDTENEFQQILKRIKLRKNGDVSRTMKAHGIQYKLNWGVSVVELREIARSFNPSHLLALKLWNKQWRETMILATLLDEPDEVTEEQMDFWTKSVESVEMVEQASANLWWKTRFAFVKALEWCRGKKHLVRFTGIHLAGRLALTDKNAIDEMFEPFFEEFLTLAKDAKLHTVLRRTIIALGNRSEMLYRQTIELSKNLQLSDSETAIRFGESLFEELSDPIFSEQFD